MSNLIMYQAIEKCKEKNIGIMVHAEDPEISKFDYRAAEDIITIRDVYLAGKIKGRVHFSHVSTRDSLAAIRYGKRAGYPITCEVTPHHLSLYDMDYRVNPPIRTEDDVRAVIEAIKDGTVDAIATDHAPHTPDDKRKGAPGMVGLETAFSVCYTFLVKKNGVNLSHLSSLMSEKPALILNLPIGLLKEGYQADLVLVDLDRQTIVDSMGFSSKGKNTAFQGKSLHGKIMVTLRRGLILYREDD